MEHTCHFMDERACPACLAGEPVTRGAGDVHQIHAYPTKPRQAIGIGVPSLGMVSIYFLARMMGLQMPFNTVSRYFYVVGREVGEARNEIVHRARKVREDTGGAVEISHLLFLDDDVLFHPGLLVKLLEHQRPIVSGLYYTKTDVSQPLMFQGDYEGIPRGWKHGDVVPVTGHGMGLCLIDMKVFEAVAPIVGIDPNGYPAFFETVRDRREAGGAVTNQTEDITFCKAARAAGYELLVDTSAPAFGFHLDTATTIGYPREQWEQFTKSGRVTWPDGVTW